MTASSAPEGSKCSSENPAAAMIQTKGPFQNTFRVKSVGEVTVNSRRTATRTVIATFGVTNFLDYVYYTNFETQDPGLYKASKPTLAEECEGKYYETWSKEKLGCPEIVFVSNDKVDGPMHTNDSADVTGGTFGREGHEPKDKIEMYEGTHGTAAGCKGGATYYTASGCYTTKEQLVEKLEPPPDDTSLAAYVEPEYEFEGRTVIELNGSEMLVHYHNAEGTELSKPMKLPPNGLIYVEDSTHHACGYTFEVESSDTPSEDLRRGVLRERLRQRQLLVVADRRRRERRDHQRQRVSDGRRRETRLEADRDSGPGTDRERLRARLPPLLQRQKRHRLAHEPVDLRRDPRDKPLVRRGQLRLRPGRG